MRATIHPPAAVRTVQLGGGPPRLYASLNVQFQHLEAHQRSVTMHIALVTLMAAGALAGAFVW